MGVTCRFVTRAAIPLIRWRRCWSWPGSTTAVARARAAVDALLANRTLRRRSAEVSAESSLRGAWASAWLEGSHLALADVRVRRPARAGRSGAAGRAAGPGGDRDAGRHLAHAPRQALARLHAVAAADLVSDREVLGRPDPPRPRRAWTPWRPCWPRLRRPAVVVAAIVHGELLSLRAFPPAAGVVARAAARLCLIDRGLDPKSLVVLEAGHRELAAEYAEALEAYRSGTAAGLARWLVHCADAVELGRARGAGDQRGARPRLSE